MKKYILLYLIFICSNNQALAIEGCPTNTNKFDSHIIFCNGILTTFSEAQNSTNELRYKIGRSYNGHNLIYRTAYNFSSKAFYDLLQAINQHGTQYVSQIFKWLNGIEVAPDWFNDKIQSLLLLENQLTASELNIHVEAYKAIINDGDLVLIISHSQGNFYANLAKQILASQLFAYQMNSLAIFGVATPANNVGGDSSINAPYITNNKDIILRVPGSLESNIDLLYNVYPGYEPVGDEYSSILAHSFLGTYLSNKFNLCNIIIYNIKAQLDKLAASRPYLSSFTIPSYPRSEEDYIASIDAYNIPDNSKFIFSITKYEVWPQYLYPTPKQIYEIHSDYNSDNVNYWGVKPTRLDWFETLIWPTVYPPATEPLHSSRLEESCEFLNNENNIHRIFNIHSLGCIGGRMETLNFKVTLPNGLILNQTRNVAPLRWCTSGDCADEEILDEMDAIYAMYGATP